MGIGDIVTEKKKQVDEWLKNQSMPVEIAAISAGSAVQGTRERDRFFFSHFISLSGGDDQLITRSLFPLFFIEGCFLPRPPASF